MTRPNEFPADRDAVFAHWPNRITGLRFVGAVVLFGLLGWLAAQVDPALSADIAGQSRAADSRDASTSPWDHRGLLLAAFVLFVVVAASDALDGYVARKYGTVTAFGRIADPFVDKILIVGAMVQLAAMDWSRAYLPAWIVVVVVAREFLVTGVRGYVESLGMAFPADWFGKLKMIVQCVAIGALLALHAVDLGEWWRTATGFVAHAAVWATLLTSLGSGLSYVFKARNMLGSLR